MKLSRRKSELINLVKMKLLPSIVIAQFGVAWALPSQLESRVYAPCSDIIYDTAYCCAVGPLGDYVDCDPPPIIVISAVDFQNQCAWVGKVALCCLRSILDLLNSLCQTPRGLSP
ncbi:hypothetical protein GGS24DRAFT_146381 [Hypoxylon argillaceum]|nr:hypothetical protein GGS24DRAFT_146381 [Hypoxylon argillaceum]